MIKKVLVIDYGAGNLNSITKALRILGLEVKVNTDFLDTDMLVLPGVGAFGSSMKLLNKIRHKIKEFVKSGKPILGICLGLQLFFERSEEEKNVEGLCLFGGKVVKFKGEPKLPVPHMCWNKVNFLNYDSKKKLILNGLKKSEFFYFVHSFYPIPENKKIIFGETEYINNFCSMVVQDNIVGTQFHLEKSGSVGLRLLKNIVDYFSEV